MKKAFTMAEALIVLGIVAILAALSVTAISSAKPDPEITMYRKAYSNLKRAVKELSADTELYPEAVVLASNPTLAQYQTPADRLNRFQGGQAMIYTDMINKYPYLSANESGNGKFALSLANKLNGFELTTMPNASNTTQGKTWKFETADGSTWSVFDGFLGSSQIAEVVVFTRGTKYTCAYGTANCTAPDIFGFQVDKTGKITIKAVTGVSATKAPSLSSNRDPVACTYLRYPKITKRSKFPTYANGNSCYQANPTTQIR